MINSVKFWRSCRTIQNVIELILSNQPHTEGPFNLEITCLITPRYYYLSGSVELQHKMMHSVLALGNTHRLAVMR